MFTNHKPALRTLFAMLLTLLSSRLASAQDPGTGTQYTCGESENYPHLTGNNGSCVVELQNQSINECDYRAFSRGVAALAPGAADTCRDQCLHCCACESDFTPAEELSLRLTCDCLVAAGVELATGGAAAAAGGPASTALAACLNYQFWIEEIPNVLAAVPGFVPEDADDSPFEDGLQEMDWDLIAGDSDHYINYLYRLRELTNALLDSNAFGPEQSAALGELGRSLARTVGYALRTGRIAGPAGDLLAAYNNFARKFIKKDGSFRWLADAANFTAGTADWIFDFCGQIKEEGNESNRRSCENDCRQAYTMPSDAGVGPPRSENENNRTGEDDNHEAGGGWGPGSPGGDPFVWTDGGEFPAYMGDPFVDPWDSPPM